MALKKQRCEACDTILLCPCCKKTKTKEKKVRRSTAAGNYARTRKGVRPDIHPTYSFKSSTEANFARLLNHFKLDWRYEERAFTFEGYKTKPYVYIMDFEVLDGNKIIPAGFYEIKGYMNGNSRQKLRRLRMHYPTEAKKTYVVVYTLSRKEDVAFCTKNGYTTFGYKEIEQSYKDDVAGWEK